MIYNHRKSPEFKNIINEINPLLCVLWKANLNVNERIILSRNLIQIQLNLHDGNVNQILRDLTDIAYKFLQSNIEYDPSLYKNTNELENTMKIINKDIEKIYKENEILEIKKKELNKIKENEENKLRMMKEGFKSKVLKPKITLVDINKQRLDAAIFVQRCYRGFLGRKVYKEMRKKKAEEDYNKKKNEAAKAIERIVRGYLTRKHITRSLAQVPEDTPPEKRREMLRNLLEEGKYKSEHKVAQKKECEDKSYIYRDLWSDYESKLMELDEIDGIYYYEYKVEERNYQIAQKNCHLLDKAMFTAEEEGDETTYELLKPYIRLAQIYLDYHERLVKRFDIYRHITSSQMKYLFSRRNELKLQQNVLRTLHGDISYSIKQIDQIDYTIDTRIKQLEYDVTVEKDKEKLSEMKAELKFLNEQKVEIEKYSKKISPDVVIKHEIKRVIHELEHENLRFKMIRKLDWYRKEEILRMKEDLSGQIIIWENDTILQLFNENVRESHIEKYFTEKCPFLETINAFRGTIRTIVVTLDPHNLEKHNNCEYANQLHLNSIKLSKLIDQRNLIVGEIDRLCQSETKYRSKDIAYTVNRENEVVPILKDRDERLMYTVVKWTKLYETEPWRIRDLHKVDIPLGNPSLDKQYEEAKQTVEKVRTKQRRLREKFSLNKEDIEELKRHDEELKKMMSKKSFSPLFLQHNDEIFPFGAIGSLSSIQSESDEEKLKELVIPTADDSIKGISDFMILYGEKEIKEFTKEQKKNQKMKLPYYTEVNGRLKYNNGEEISMWYKECEDQFLFISEMILSHSKKDNKLYVDMSDYKYSFYERKELAEGENGFNIWFNRGTDQFIANIALTIGNDRIIELSSQHYKKIDINLSEFGLDKDSHIWFQYYKRNIPSYNKFTRISDIQNEIENIDKLLNKYPEDYILSDIKENANKKLEELMKYKEEELKKLQNECDKLEMNIDEMNQFEKCFNKIDTKGYGFITMEELFSFIGEPITEYSKRLFKYYAREDSISHITLCNALKTIGPYCLLNESEILKMIIKLYDKTQKGSITKEQLLTTIHQLNENNSQEFKVNEICSDIDKYINPTRDVDFGTINNLHISQPILLFPAFKLQLSLMNSFCSKNYWKEKKNKFEMEKRKMNEVNKKQEAEMRRKTHKNQNVEVNQQ